VNVDVDVFDGVLVGVLDGVTVEVDVIEGVIV